MKASFEHHLKKQLWWLRLFHSLWVLAQDRFINRCRKSSKTVCTDANYVFGNKTPHSNEMSGVTWARWASFMSTWLILQCSCQWAFGKLLEENGKLVLLYSNVPESQWIIHSPIARTHQAVTAIWKLAPITVSYSWWFYKVRLLCLERQPMKYALFARIVGGGFLNDFYFPMSDDGYGMIKSLCRRWLAIETPVQRELSPAPLSWQWKVKYVSWGRVVSWEPSIWGHVHPLLIHSAEFVTI